MERSFPKAVAERINELGRGAVVAEPVIVDGVRLDLPLAYDLILDRISQDIPFYRTMLKYAVLRGTEVVNNPFWWTCEDKFSANAIGVAAGVAIPKTVLLPHKSHPPGTKGESFSNLKFPLGWEEIFEYLGFPIFLKPALGGGWKNVYKCNNKEEFFSAFDKTADLTMIAQEAIQFDAYYRCYCIGRERVLIMRYDPSRPYLQNYVADEPPASPELKAKMERDAKALCEALGHDFNTVEFAVRNGVPVAIDFTNPAPDADVNSVGKTNFEWVVKNAAEFLIERARNPRPFATTGMFPALFPQLKSGAPARHDVVIPAAPQSATREAAVHAAAAGAITAHPPTVHAPAVKPAAPPIKPAAPPVPAKPTVAAKPITTQKPVASKRKGG
jgi:glutathione synthase/RimK-type ligase-like ATP-grasp enzyme